MTRVLLVAAAGHGTRLRSTDPKLLVQVDGRPMIDWVLDRYSMVSAAIIIVSPAARARAAKHLAGRPAPIHLVEQPRPTGMLDAVFAARDLITLEAPQRIWITWCDQVAISRETVQRLMALEVADSGAAAIFPVVQQSPPYIHFDRDDRGRIVTVRQRREGDAMPRVGTSDAGLFSLSASAYLRDLPLFGREAPTGTVTGERNFLPFLPWLAVRKRVLTFTIPASEARGVNTPDDVVAVTKHLQQARVR